MISTILVMLTHIQATKTDTRDLSVGREEFLNLAIAKSASRDE